jgi:hypothetical protein
MEGKVQDLGRAPRLLRLGSWCRRRGDGWMDGMVVVDEFRSLISSSRSGVSVS